MSERRDPSSFFGDDHPMGEHAREAGSLTKTHDDRYRFRGIWDQDPEGVCRVRILQRQEGAQPVMILSELDENGSTSVTNLIEVLAAELIARHFPHRFEAVADDPVLLIEHYPPRAEPRRGASGRPEYDRVTFGAWRPRKIWLGGQERRSLGEPDWTHLPDDRVRALLGDEADDLPAAGS